MNDTEIRICSSHMEQEKTPLIWTFAFNGAEYWCPACGANYSMLGAGKLVPFTRILHNRLIRYRLNSKAFLKARGLMICAYFRYKGKDIRFNDLPERSKNYWIKKKKSWKYKF